MQTNPAGNTLKQATRIDLKNGSSIQKGWMGRSNRNDFFKFRLNSRSSLNVALSNLEADANLALLDRKGRLIERSSRKGTSRETFRTQLKGGTYYIRVFRKQGNTDYQLKLSTSAPARSRSVPNVKTFMRQVLSLTNGIRRNAGLAPLRLNAKLATTAKAHSRDMGRNDFFSHTGSDGSSPFDRMQSAGYRYSWASENVAAGYNNPQSVMNAWMASAGHRANILDPQLKEIGIGYYYLAKDTGSTNFNHYWTQTFGTPFQ